MIITHSKALEIIREHGQRFFSVRFIKQDGTARNMTCKLHAHNKAVEANQTGRKQSKNKDLTKVRVFDMVKKSFRTINVGTLTNLKIDGIEYEIKG